MTLAEKLRFLANRAEDGKEFYWGVATMKFYSETMMLKNPNGNWLSSYIEVNDIDDYDLKLKPRWEFTEDEKAILRNLPTEYHWIARDDICDGLFAYTLKPTKFEHSWSCMGSERNLNIFKHILQSIKWTDDEPCEFRRYL